MPLRNIDFNAIRPIKGSKDKGFEEFICQLAKREKIPNAVKFIRNGTPDGGIECYWTLSDGTKWAWQAKYFHNSLEDSQFRQIEKSLNAALANDGSISKYFIAIPIDPPSSNIKGKTNMMTKWNHHISKWKEHYPNTEIVAWWNSNLITLLQKPTNLPIMKFWFDKMFLDDGWFTNQNKFAIKDLGPRYSPEINVNIDSSEIFDGIEASKKVLERYGKKLDSLLQELRGVLKYEHFIPNELSKNLKILIDELLKAYSNHESNLNEKIDFTFVIDTTKKLLEIIYKIYTISEESIDNKNIEKSKNDSVFKEYSDFRRKLETCRDILYDLDEFTNSYPVRLYGDPFLVLTGNAGVGKSHQMAYYIENRNARDLKSILLLGQKFTNTRDPKTQILEQLDLDCKFDEFLEALNTKAEIEQNRIIIFIDAINEGAGYKLWKDNLNGLIFQIKQYKNLGVILSIRSTYTTLFADILKGFCKYQLDGFYGIGYKATKVFFSYYKIKTPTIPLLNPEFLNPLFLKLFCEGLNKNGIDSFNGNDYNIDYVFSFYIDAINKRIFKENCDLKILEKIIKALIDLQIQHGQNVYFTCDTIASICKKICQDYNISGNPWHELISEGLLFEDCYGETKYVRFAYERLNDFLLVKYIVTSERLPDIKYILRAFRRPDEYQGIYDALAILLPLHRGKEIFEYLRCRRLEEVVAISFIESLSWRKKDNFNSKHSDFVNKIAVKYKNVFFNALIACAANPNCYFNANKSHEYLMSYTLPERDSRWTIFLNNNYEYRYAYAYDNSIRRLLEWAFYEDDKSIIPNDIIELSCTMLTWFLVSQNRRLRDTATKALVVLLRDRPSITIKILKKFEDVNDPYIKERLYAVAYGVSLRSKDLSFLHDLSIYIYNTIFNKSEVYPHVLLRDYARGIIEYATVNNIKLDIDKAKITPPYKSNFPNIPTDDEIKKYYVDFDTIKKHNELWALKAITGSMTVEYPRNGGMYGDFGRYIFQSAISNFKDNNKTQADFISDMHNIAVERIFSLGYDVKKHGFFDHCVASQDRDAPKIERIGKKYQWIALYELLAYISDKYKITDNFWGNEGASKPFSGPWDVIERGIDPSYTGKICFNVPIPEIQYNTWEENITEWVKNKKDFPDPKSIISGGNKEWILLSGHLHWNRPKEIGVSQYESVYAMLFYHFNGYFVYNRDFNKIKSWLESKNFYGRWLPEPHNVNQIFIGEYPWRINEINKDYNTDRCSFTERIETGEYEENVILDLDEIMNNIFYDNKLEDKSIKKKLKKLKTIRYPKTREIEIGSAFHVTMADYSNSDLQVDSLDSKSVNIPLPCKMLFDHFGLHLKEYENLLYDKNDKLVCFSNKHNLYFEKDSLIAFLHENDMKIIWTLLAEKSIDPRESGPNINTLSGVYSLSSEKEIVGTSKFSLTPTKKISKERVQ